MYLLRISHLILRWSDLHDEYNAIQGFYRARDTSFGVDFNGLRRVGDLCYGGLLCLHFLLVLKIKSS